MAQGNDKSLPTLANELWALVVTYLKQETVEPLKGLARFVGLGLLGSVLLAIGLLLVVVAGLRALQYETAPHLTGHWSWVPYLAVLVFSGLAAGLAGRAITSKKRKADKKGTVA